MSFLKQNLIAYFIFEFLVQANLTDDPIESFLEVGLETVLTLLFVVVILNFNKTLYAFVQVATAILFCANVISLLIVPVLVWLTLTEHTLSYYAVFLLLLWSYTLVTYIIKQVLMLDTIASLAVSLFYVVFTYGGSVGLGQLI